MVEQVAEAAVKAEKVKDPRKNLQRVIVNRVNVNEKNTDLVISVNDLGDPANGRKSFFPGQEVELSEVHIDILKNACERSRIDIDLSSAIYNEPNPQAVAQQQNPGWLAKTDPHAGTVYITRTKPNYVITPVG